MMSRPFLICLFMALAAQPALPAEPSVSAFPRPSWFRQHFASPRTSVQLQLPRRLSDFVMGGKLQLSLASYLELVLQNNTDIALAKLQVETPANAITRAFSAYDPWVSASFSNTRAVQTSINQLEGVPTVKTLSQPLSGTYSQTLPSGTSFMVKYDAQRYSSNQTYSTYNPILSSNLTVGFEQPLLQNRGAAFTKMNILVAKSTLSISRRQVSNLVMQIIASAEGVYWDVVQAREYVSLMNSFLELRAAALDRAQKQVDAGALLPLELYQPKSDYASAQLAVIQAKRAMAQRENALREQVGADLDPAIRSLPVELTERLDMTVLSVPDKEEAVSNALALRPDAQAAREGLDVDSISIRRANEALRPNLSITGSYTSQGVGGTFLATSVPGGLGDALSQMFRFGSPVYSFGLKLRFPIRDRSAAADSADASVKKKQDSLNVRKLEQRIRRETLDAIDNLEAARASLENAQLAREFALKRVEAEQKKYELGLSSVFYLLTAQSAQNAAESSVLDQLIAYRRNLLNYYVITGQLLQERGVALQ
jgi:outer membrane protein